MSFTNVLANDAKRRLTKRLGLRRSLAGGVATSFVDIPVAGLPAGLDGFRIVQISDFHIGAGLWEPEFAADAAQAVRDTDPDIVVNTGDFVQGLPHWERVTSLVTQFVLDDTKSPYRPMNLAILGNHDYYLDDLTVNELSHHLGELGLTVLTNRTVCISGPGGNVFVGGFSIEVGGFEEAVESLRHSDSPRLALVLEPEVAERLPKAAADIVLAGHTHGGQIALPGLELATVQRFCGSHYVNGLYRVNDMPLWINRGLGCTGIPVRFRAPPEVTVITLVR
ncbi:MAG: hypothetical protein NVS9B15_25650 [Acidobacteriaceae bacterium]